MDGMGKAVQTGVKLAKVTFLLDSSFIIALKILAKGRISYRLILLRFVQPQFLFSYFIISS